MINYEQASQLPRSEKITLVTCEAVKLVKIFEQVADYTYAKEIDQVVVKVKIDGLDLEESPSFEELGPTNQWFYDIKQKKLFLYVFEAPSTQNVSLVLRFFFSNSPIILPYDLSSGEEVEWNPIISSIGSIGQQLDDENTGIVLESQSKINFINNTGFFDKIFDSLIWENQKVTFYSYFGGIAINEAKKIFEGVIESKDFSGQSVVFNVRDFVFRLKNLMSLELFTELDATDGKITDSILGTPKRRIYGKAKQVRAVGVSNVLDGFLISGKVSLTVDSQALTGLGTSFLSQLTPGDEIRFTSLGVEYKYGIESVLDDANATINKKSEVSAVLVDCFNSPNIPYRQKNRYWNICGHKLREPETAITLVISENRIEVANTVDLFPGDKINIGGVFASIRRITGNTIVTENNISPAPTVGQVVKKYPIQNAYFGDKELIFGRDWFYFNEPTKCELYLTELAEFNITQEKLANYSFQFTNGSRTITTTATIDLRTILKPRDWIRKNSIVSGQTDWFEILEVQEQTITLREPVTGTTEIISALIKEVNYIGDESLITVNTLGFEDSGNWIRTASDAVRHMILNDAKYPSVNESSFIDANVDCDFTLSIVVPDVVGGKIPTIRETITKINESVFGSLYGNSSETISFSVLNSNKPEYIEIIKDDDIISFSVDTINDIRNNIVINYRPFVDHQNGEDTWENISYNSGFVDNFIGIENTLEKNIYLYDDKDAELIAQRYALFKSMSSTKVKLNGKSSFFNNYVNDKIIIKFDRLFSKFGAQNKIKVGIITGTRKSEFASEVTISDLAVYTRVPAIAPVDAADYSLAGDDEIIRWGYICDDDTLTPDATKDDNLGCNLIG